MRKRKKKRETRKKKEKIRGRESKGDWGETDLSGAHAAGMRREACDEVKKDERARAWEK